ncbi:MAG: hypothetical protein Q8M19_05670 [Reyranella sp.]|nr:hypothetical protein [Reyranella sp.]
MFDFVPLLLRSLLTSIVGMMVVVGAAHAHSSRYAGNGQLAEHVATGSFAETRSSLLKACVEHATGSSGVVLLISQLTAITESDASENGDFDSVFDSGCCAVACHAAVMDLSLISCVAFRPTSFEPLMSSTALHGRAIGPGDRPPRLA